MPLTNKYYLLCEIMVETWFHLATWYAYCSLVPCNYWSLCDWRW